MVALNSELYMQLMSQYFNPSKTYSAEWKRVKKNHPYKFIYIYRQKGNSVHDLCFIFHKMLFISWIPPLPHVQIICLS